MNKQIKFGALLSYISIAVNIAAGLLYTPWMIDKIGKGDFGLYTLANSVITLFLVDFGLSSAVSRFVSKYRAEGNQEKINHFLGAVYKLYFIIDAIILVVLTIIFFFIDDIYVKLTPQELEKFKVVYVIAASSSIIIFPFVPLKGILNSYEEFIKLKLGDLLYRFFLVGFNVFALSYGFGLYTLVSINSIMGIVLTIYHYTIVKKFTKVKISFERTEISLYKEIFGFSIWVTVTALAQRLIFNITPSILGVVANSAAIAVFGIVTTIEGYTYIITTAINGMFMPKISRIYEGGQEKEELMPLMNNVGKFQFAINGLIVAGFASVGKDFINLWMDKTYSDAYWGILLVIIPGLFYNSMEIANTAMIVKKKVNLQAYVNVGMGIINVIFSFLLSTFFGVIGACVSIFIAYMVRAVALLIIYKKVLKLDIIQFIKNCYLHMGLPIIITILLGLGLNYLLTENSWFVFVAKAVAVVIVYALTTMFIGLNKSERIKLLKLRRKNNG